MERALKLKGGVLIIGSLLWQDNAGKNDKSSRRDWRNSRLDIPSAIGVKVPIRYGRLSLEGVYTMTFANSCRGKHLGTAFAIPFRNNPTTNLTELLFESRALAVAEGMRGKFISSSRRGQPWCILGVLFNKKKIPLADRTIITEWWHGELSKEVDFLRFHPDNFKHGSEKPCILSNGVLNIPWAVPVNENDQKSLDEFDFLLATATLPTDDKYPSIETLVKAVKADTNRKYFLKNFKNNITTFQDARINEKLNLSNETDEL